MKWLLEFVIEGSKLGEHVQRFDLSSGRYATIPRTDWLIVDFRPQSSGEPSLLFDRVLHVIYDDETFATARAVMMDKEVIELFFRGGLIRTMSDLAYLTESSSKWLTRDSGSGITLSTKSQIKRSAAG